MPGMVGYYLILESLSKYMSLENKTLERGLRHREYFHSTGTYSLAISLSSFVTARGLDVTESKKTQEPRIKKVSDLPALTISASLVQPSTSSCDVQIASPS